MTDEEPRVGVFICHCGHNIASVVDVEAVAREAAAMGNVVHAETDLYTCSDNCQESIRQIIKQKRLNRVVVASCSPRTHEPLFQETLRESGLNPFLFAMTNIRDQCSWVHRDDPVQATEKACDLMRMAVGRARLLRSLERGRLPITRSALVLGGGLAGMTAALSLADQGFETHLVEKTDALGGNLRSLHCTLEGADVQAFAKDLIERVQANPLLRLHLSSELVEFNGHVGNFSSVIRSEGQETTISHGVADHRDRGRRARVRGASVREERARDHATRAGSATRRARPASLGENPTVVMIQCVGSRTEENNYCSRVCCAEAVKNALAMKSQSPGRPRRRAGEGHPHVRLPRDVLSEGARGGRPVHPLPGGRGAA